MISENDPLPATKASGPSPSVRSNSTFYTDLASYLPGKRSIAHERNGDEKADGVTMSQSLLSTKDDCSDILGFITELSQLIDHEFTRALEVIAKSFESFGIALWQVRGERDQATINTVSQWFASGGVSAFHDLPLKDCFTGRAIEEQSPCHINHVWETPEIGYFDFCAEWLKYNHINALTTAPIDYLDGTRGALTLYWQKEEKRFSGEPFRVFQKLAELTPRLYQSAMDQAGLRLVKKANAILQNGRRIEESPGTDRVIREMGDLVHQTLHPLMTFIYLRDPIKEDVARLCYSAKPREKPAPSVSYKSDKGLIAWVLRNRRPLIIPDLAVFEDKYDYWQEQYPQIKWHPGEDIETLIRERNEVNPGHRCLSLVVVPILLLLRVVQK